MNKRQFWTELLLLIILFAGICFALSGCSASVGYCHPPRRIYYHPCPQPIYIVPPPHYHCW